MNKSWREIVAPHKDVLEGTFKQSEFAADLTQVISGTAPDEYKKPEMFYSRTFITEGMKFLLMSVAQRLSGNGGDPVIQLQTSFGGGKTHAMIAAYHLAKRDCDINNLQGVPPILDQAGVKELPQAQVAVIDGNNMSPSESKTRGPVTVNTIWGSLHGNYLGNLVIKLLNHLTKMEHLQGRKN